MASVSSSNPIVVCFAVREEARFFNANNARGCLRIITGMGERNAVAAVEAMLKEVQPRLVITAGFAGGLNPKIPTGTVLFETDEAKELRNSLASIGAIPGTFHFASHVAVSVEEKAALWKSTGADAVEMESGSIRRICRERGILGATVRSISDAAGEALPLDFNALMTPDKRIDFLKLGWAIISSPGSLPALMAFRKKTIHAARELGRVLEELAGGS